MPGRAGAEGEQARAAAVHGFGLERARYQVLGRPITEFAIGLAACVAPTPPAKRAAASRACLLVGGRRRVRVRGTSSVNATKVREGCQAGFDM